MFANEVPPSEWAEFFQRFTGQHRGGRVTLTVGASGRPVRVVADEQPLIEVAPQRLPGGQTKVTIVVGSDSGQPTIQVIEPLARLWYHETSAGEQLGVAMATTDGTLAELRFRVPVLVEALDGLPG